MLLMDKLHFVPLASAYADSWDDFMEGAGGSAGVVYTDIFNLAKYRKVLFVVQKAGGATGTATITVESCDDTTPSTPTAVAFKYKASTTLDTFGATTACASTGLATTAGADQCYLIEVDASDLNSTDKYVRLKLTELVDAECEGTILTILGDARIDEDVHDTALS